MNIEAGHRYGTVRMGAFVLAASFAVLVILVASGAAEASSSPERANSAGLIVAEARAAMMQAGSVSSHGGGTAELPGVGRVTIVETNYVDTTSGSQQVTMTPPTPGGAVLPAGTTRDVDGTVYANANAPFWTATVGMGTGAADRVAGRWVLIPHASPAYGPAVADLTMASLTRDLFHASRYDRGRIQMVDGQVVLAIRYTNTGNDSGPTTCFVAVGGSHLPVLVTMGGLSLHLGSWGRSQPVAAPAGTVPLPAPTSSTASGLPVVA